MKNIILAAVLAILAALMMVSAAWSGEYFNPAEQKEIRRIVARVLPGAKVDFGRAVVGDPDISIGPLRNGMSLCIFVNEGNEILTYALPIEYDYAAQKIFKTVHHIIDNLPASDPRALGRNLPGGLPENE